MPDFYLQALMTGALAKKKMSTNEENKDKDLIQIDIENKIDEYLDTIDFSSDDKLQSPQHKRAHLKAEMLKEVKGNNSFSYIQSALDLLAKEAKNYLETSEVEVLLEQFADLGDKVNALEPEAELTANFQTLLHISEETMSAIFRMATAKFMELEYAHCMTLFMLLSSLNDNRWEYWLRAGIAAQEFNELELAVQAYSRALVLNNDLIDARLFAIECCMLCDRLVEAQMHYRKAKDIAETINLESEYRDLLTTIESNYGRILG